MTDLQFSTIITALASIAGVLVGSVITLFYNLFHYRAEKKQRIFELKKSAYESLISAIKQWRSFRAFDNSFISTKGELSDDETERYLREYTKCMENVIVSILNAKFFVAKEASETIDHFYDVFESEPAQGLSSDKYCESEEQLLSALQTDLFSAKLPKPKKQKPTKSAKR